MKVGNKGSEVYMNEMHLDESFHLDHASRNSDFRFQLNSVAQLNFMT